MKHAKLFLLLLVFLSFKAYSFEVSEEFKVKLALSESSGNADTINTADIGIGLYQFTEPTLRWLGYSNITVEKFREDPRIFPKEEQDRALNKLVNKNYSILKRKGVLDETIGKNINGVHISLSGLIAGCHLAGAGGVIDFLSRGTNPEDYYGTSPKKYIVKFKNIDVICLDSNHLNKKSKSLVRKDVSLEVVTPMTLLCNMSMFHLEQKYKQLTISRIDYSTLILESKSKYLNTMELYCILDRRHRSTGEYVYPLVSGR